MLRLIVLGLVAANLLFFGWSLLVSEPAPTLQAVPAGKRTAPLPPPPPPPCATLGPFREEVTAEAVQRQVEKAGWGVMRREVVLQVNDGYWVYVTGLTSASDQARVLRALRRTGMQDAFAMPDDPEHRVSVGIFNEAQGAEERARRVRVLRLEAEVAERKRAQSEYWLDVPGVAPRTLGDGRLVTAGVNVKDLTLETCPPQKPPAVPGV